MTKSNSHPIRWSLISVATATFIVTESSAQEVPRPDTSEWKCEQCPFAKGHDGQYELGAGYVSDDAARFANGTGYDKGGHVVANGEGSHASDDHRMEWELEDLGLDSRSVKFNGGKPGTYEYGLEYSELPYRRYDTTQTIFREASKEQLVLPSGWVPAGTTAGFTALNQSLVSRNIESDRTTMGASGNYRGLEHFRFEADYRHSERDGWGIAGAAFYSTSSLLAAPIDDHTDTATLAAIYGDGHWTASLSWIGSFYKDANEKLRWDNPFISGGQGALSTAPDNDAQTIAVDASYRFASPTTVSLSAAFGQMRQDDAFLPYTINPTVAPRALPRQSLDGKIDTTHIDARIVSQPWSFLHLRGVYRYEDRDNSTPVAQWTRTITDLFDSGETEANRPYSFQRQTLELSATAHITSYDWLKSFEFEGGYNRVDLTRTLQEVEKSSEDIGWGRVRWRPRSDVELALRGGIARRDPNNYDLNVAQANEQNPLMRKYTLAYRFKDFLEFKARSGWPGLPISFGAEAYYSTTNYTESPLGLTKNDDRRFAADFTWAINEKYSTYVQGGYEDIALAVFNSETFSAADWNSQHRDRFRTFDGGVRFKDVGRWDGNLSVRYARGTGGIEVQSMLSGSGQYPGLVTDLKGGELDVGYRLNDAMDLRFRMRYENFSSSDWALQGVGPQTIPTVLTLGAAPDNYNVYLFALSVRYSFGRAKHASAETEEAAPAAH